MKQRWGQFLVAVALLFPLLVQAQKQPEHTESAQEQAVRQAFEKYFPEIELAGVRATSFANLFELQVGRELLYTNGEAEFIFQGALLDSKTRQDLTEASLQDLNKMAIEDFPLDKAIKLVKGDGSRKVVVFEDPNCPFCKRMHKTLDEVSNVTIYSMMMPILSPDSRTTAEYLWCADDPAKALNDWMLHDKKPVAKTCDNPLDELLALGQSLGIRGTPASYFSNGQMMSGWMPADQLNAMLDQK